MRKTRLLKHFLLLFALIAGSTGVWAQDAIYSWNGNGKGSAQTANETGGTATAKGGNSNVVVGAKEKGNWCLKLGKGFSSGENYIEITLDNALTGGETVIIGSFTTNTSATATATLGIDFGTTDTQTLYSDHTILTSNGTPDDWTITVPAAANNSKTIRVYRNAGSTTVFVSKLIVLSSTYTVTYDANGATSGTVPVDDTEYDADNNTVTVLGNTGNLAKTDYIFSGWNTKADGTGTNYVSGNTFTISASTTLYAKWVAKTPIATIGNLPLSELNVGEGSIPLAGLLAYITFAEGKTVADCVPTIESDNTSVLDVSFSDTDLLYNAKKAGTANLTLTLTPVDTENYATVSKQAAITVVDPSTAEEVWALTSLADLTANDVFVIVGNDGSNNYALPHNNGSSTSPAAVAVTISGTSLTSAVSDDVKWNLSGNATNGYTFYPNGITNKWLYCNTTNATGSNNNIRIGTGNRKVFELDSDNYLVTKDDNTDRYVSVYNATDWRGYINTTTAPTTIAFYKKVTGDVLTPSIVANDVELAYDATYGEISFTINNPVETPSVTGAFTSANWISDVSFSLTSQTEGKVTFTTTANNTSAARTATIELRYEDATKIVNVTQAAAPVVYSTIPDLFAAATSTATDVNVTFNNWVVSGVSTNGKNVFVTDGTNGFVIYSSSDQSNTYAVGNVLSGTAVSCKLQLYNGFAEITNLNASDLTITTGGTVSVADIAMADLAGVNTGALVSYENLTCSVDGSKYYLSDGTTTLQVYNALFAFDALEDGKTYNITGIYQQYNTTKEILPRSADDIVEVVNQKHNATFSVNGAATVVEVEEGSAITFPEKPEDIYGMSFVGWITTTIEGTTNTAPEFVSSATMGTNDMTFYAVFAEVSGTPATLTKMASGDTFSAGDNVVIVANVDDETAYALYQETQSNSYVKYYSFTANAETIGADDKNMLTVSAGSDGKWKLGDATDGYLYTSGSNNLSVDKIYSTDWTLEDNNDGTFKLKGGSNNRYVSCRSDLNGDNQYLFRMAGSTPAGVYSFDIYKFVAGSATYSDYCTTVPTTVPASVTAYKWATFSSNKNLNFGSVSGNVKAYIVTGADGKTILTQQVNGTVKAGTGLLLYSETETENVEIPVAEEGDDFSDCSDNKLIAVTKDNTVINKATDGTTNYVLSVKNDKAVFAYINNTPATLHKGQAYLNLEGEESAPYLGFGDEGTTGIVNVNRETITNNQYYTLDGRRVENPSNGVYIVNGKKVVIK